MIFSGKKALHLDGKKKLTTDKHPQTIKDFEYVYIPLLNMASTNIEVYVKEGDYVKVGEMVACRKDHFYLPIFSSVSGTVEGIEKMMSVNLAFAEHVKIKNDFKYDHVDKKICLDVNTASKEEIVEAIKECGITGRGGSGFPTYVKYNSDAKIDSILINAVECEPYITLDYHLIMNYQDDLLNGVELLLKASGANKAIIAVKKGKTDLIETINKLVSDKNNIVLREVPDVYPMGWERVLIKEVFNKDYDKLPAEIGVVVSNSTTAMRISQALSGKMSMEVGITCSGEGLKNPSTVIVPVGTKVSEVIERIGGYKDDVTSENAKLVVGGPMMGRVVPNDEIALVSYSNAINILYDEGYQEMPCLRCSRCVDVCPIGLQPVAIKDAEIKQDVDLLKKLGAENCVSCGLCSYICPSRIQVTDYTTKGKTRVLRAK